MQQASHSTLLPPVPEPPHWETLFSFAGGAAGGGITYYAQGMPSTLDCLGHYWDFSLHTLIGAVIGVLVQKGIQHILSYRRKGGPQ